MRDSQCARERACVLRGRKVIEAFSLFEFSNIALPPPLYQYTSFFPSEGSDEREGPDLPEGAGEGGEGEKNSSQKIEKKKIAHLFPLFFTFAPRANNDDEHSQQPWGQRSSPSRTNSPSRRMTSRRCRKVREREGEREREKQNWSRPHPSFPPAPPRPLIDARQSGGQRGEGVPARIVVAFLFVFCHPLILLFSPLSLSLSLDAQI